MEYFRSGFAKSRKCGTFYEILKEILHKISGDLVKLLCVTK